MIERLELRQLLSTTMYSTIMREHPIGIASPLTTAAPTGTTPATMRTAYGLNSISGDGTGQTIAIVDAYNEPTIVTDMIAFDNYYSLPAVALTVVNQTGGSTLPANDAVGGWGTEIALDVEWAHVMAPKAAILLVEATSASDSDLYAAVDYARNYPGVSAVSMSWGADETSTDSASDSHFTTPSGHQGVTFLSSSGDAGAYSDTGQGQKLLATPQLL